MFGWLLITSRTDSGKSYALKNRGNHHFGVRRHEPNAHVGRRLRHSLQQLGEQNALLAAHRGGGAEPGGGLIGEGGIALCGGVAVGVDVLPEEENLLVAVLSDAVHVVHHDARLHAPLSSL